MIRNFLYLHGDHAAEGIIAGIVTLALAVAGIR